MTGAVSWWLRDAGDLSPRPPLDGSTRVDVAVLGAGYTGLWTAYELLRREPSLSVAVLEREIAGYGASGRNGGWCSADLNVGLGSLARRFGEGGARAIHDALIDTVDEIGRVADAEGIDAQYRKGGMLLVARGPHQLPDLEADYRDRISHGYGDRVTLLGADATQERVRIAGAVASVHDQDCAVIHPGRLVRGLAEAVERRGGVIYEGTTVTAVEPGRPARLRTDRGDVTADTVVLAGEAYLTELPALHRRLLPVYSLVVVTEPIDDDTWTRIGWQGHECIASMRLTVDYLSRTADGRIVFGGRGAPYHFGSRIDPAFDRDPDTHAMLRRSVVEWFPALAGIGFDAEWGGPLGMSRDWMPSIRHVPQHGLALAAGYVGHGVATANLAGRTLADLITDRTSPLTELPLVGRRLRRWPVEPLRWGVARYLQRSLARIDERTRRSGEPRSGRSLAELLVRH